MRSMNPATTTPLMPAAFLGHGSPMNALEENRYSNTWQSFGAEVPRPRAIVMVSAHWFTTVTAVTAMARPRTIHDFYGFPKALFDVQYPAPGDPGVAQEVADVAKPVVVGLDRDSWGLDHGTWSVLVHAFPAADVPVVQLSIDARQPFEYHLDLGARLHELRKRGILVVGSGNVVHNLRAIDWSRPDGAFDWARRFDDAAREMMTNRPGDIVRLQEHPEFHRAVPTPDHFLPLVYVAGLAAAEGRAPRVLVDGYAYGSLSMTAYVLDADRPRPDRDARPAARLPDPAVIPPEDTNT
jgi:4,5-DOPA dioxygenase extradiol